MTWNDEESKGSQKEDDLVSNQVAFFGTLVSGNQLFIQGCSGSIATDTFCLSVKSGTVTIDKKSAINSVCHSNYDYGDEFEKDDESL